MTKFKITDCTINAPKFGIHGNHHNKWLDNFITITLIYKMPMISHLLPYKNQLEWGHLGG